MYMNNTAITLGIIIALLIGGIGGYVAGKNSTNSTHAEEIQQMTDMMKSDGESAAKMGGMMMTAGAMLEDRGTKYNDQEMVMMGKDLSVSGKKHQQDGQSMTSGNMMGMTANGNMENMPGMDMEGMDHSKM